MAHEEPADTFVRFMRMVAISKRKGGCWTWIGNRPDGKYGHFWIDAKAVKAHRWIFSLINGEIPDGLIIRHKCDNPSCVNPLHLESGDQADNVKDMLRRGRGANRRGEKHPLARLTAENVLEIRLLASLGSTQAAIAERFPIKAPQVGKIVRRENWRHV